MSVSFSSYNDCVCSTFVFLQKNVQRLTVLCTSSVYLPLSRFFFSPRVYKHKSYNEMAHYPRLSAKDNKFDFPLVSLNNTFWPVRTVGRLVEGSDIHIPHDAFDNQALVDLLCMQSSAITCTPFVDLFYITQKWTITVLQYVTTALPSSPLK